MTTHPAAQPTAEGTNGTITNSIQDIATLFAEMSTELGRFSEQVLNRLADIDAQRDNPRQPSEGSARPSGMPPPTAARQAVPVPLPGEPVDTSFARPAHSPAAHAAGVFPPQGPCQQAAAQHAPSAQQAAAQHAPHSAAGSHVADPAGPCAPAPRQEAAPPPLFDRVAHWIARHRIRLLGWASGAVALLGIVLLLVMTVQRWCVEAAGGWPH